MEPAQVVEHERYQQSRRSFLRRAAGAMLVGVPAAAAALGRPAKAGARTVCEYVVCGCTGCIHVCGGTIMCGAACFDPWTGDYCGDFCTGDQECNLHCTFC